MQKIKQADEEDCLSEAELRAKIEALTPPDHLRLSKAAGYYAKNDLDADDLYQQAFAQALAGERNCPRNIEVRIFLANAMRSIAYAQRQKRLRASMPLVSEIFAVGTEEYIADPNCVTADAMIIEKQRHAADRAIYDQLFEIFKDDQDATLILMGTADGLSREEICKLGEMDQTRYESTRKRIRRARDKHFPEGWKP